MRFFFFNRPNITENTHEIFLFIFYRPDITVMVGRKTPGYLFCLFVCFVFVFT